jgi:predicted nuclease with TOPRIM domain
MKQEISEALVEFYHQVLRPEFAGINAKLAEHDERFREIDGHFDCVYHRLDRLDQEMQATNHGLKRVEGRVDQLETKVDKLETKVDKLDAKIDKLDAKVDGIAADLSAHRRDTEAHGREYLVSE